MNKINFFTVKLYNDKSFIHLYRKDNNNKLLNNLKYIYTFDMKGLII